MNRENHPAVPALPAKELPAGDWEHARLYKHVREAIASLPIYFRTETHISGIMATDLHTLNTVLGATIEEQVVRTLNLIRNTWDPDERYALHSFVRQAQTFPDVLLRGPSSGEILMGIELKGWYLLAKEAEPSLRFQATAEHRWDHEETRHMSAPNGGEYKTASQRWANMKPPKGDNQHRQGDDRATPSHLRTLCRP